MQEGFSLLNPNKQIPRVNAKAGQKNKLWSRRGKKGLGSDRFKHRQWSKCCKKKKRIRTGLVHKKTPKRLGNLMD